MTDQINTNISLISHNPTFISASFLKCLPAPDVHFLHTGCLILRNDRPSHHRDADLKSSRLGLKHTHTPFYPRDSHTKQRETPLTFPVQSNKHKNVQWRDMHIIYKHTKMQGCHTRTHTEPVHSTSCTMERALRLNPSSIPYCEESQPGHETWITLFPEYTHTITHTSINAWEVTDSDKHKNKP